MIKQTKRKFRNFLHKKTLRLKRKTYKNKKYSKKGGVKRDNNFLIQNFDNLSSEEMLNIFKEDLYLCKLLETDIIKKSRVIKNIKFSSKNSKPYDKPVCKYDIHGCYQKNPKHFEQFSHPSRDEPNDNSESRQYMKLYSDCTDKLIIGAYSIFKKNNGIFPNDFYGIVTEYLKASDFSDFRQYHFNVLANMCENMEKYAYLYDEDLYKRFITNFLFVLEEACAVTGMYFTNDFKKCLNKLGLSGQESTFLSNTNLYMSNILQSLRKQ